MKRLMAALVVGNAAYPEKNNLANPANDANDLGAKLKRYGFEVITATDCSAAEMGKQLKSFRTLLDTHHVGLFFFAGHGMQIEGSNYLLALDTDMDSEDDAKHSSLPLDKVVDIMAKSKASTKIIILDACRNNPWERRWHRAAGTRGLASVYAPKGTIIGFATSPGEVAYDGIGRNGTYTAALLQHIDTPDCSIETMFKRVRNTVAAASSGKQTSWEHTSLSGEFFFNMSLGKLIDEYDVTALADSLLTLDEGKKSHKIISGLKSHNWYVQNPALALLDAASANRMAKDSLFVIGRNIYQAACGGANSAEIFINDFMGATRGFEKGKRKAILDGVLFEIFFDSKGILRKKIKPELFNEAFELQKYVELKDSFDFIAEVLTATGAEFHSFPGKEHDLAVTVSAKKKKDGFYIDAIYVGAANVLLAEEDAWDSGDETLNFLRIGADQLSHQLAAELAVPARLLKLTYTPGEAAGDKLRIPMGWTVRR